MSERFDVSIRVVSQKGFCGQQHKVGEEWVVKGRTAEGICVSAFGAMMPFLNVMRYAGSDGFPWEKDPDVTQIACPDGANPVIFEIRRLRE